MHGYASRGGIEQTSAKPLLVNYGTIYPALRSSNRKAYRVHWGVSENNRRTNSTGSLART